MSSLVLFLWLWRNFLILVLPSRKIHIWCWRFSSDTSLVEWFKLLASLSWCMLFNIHLFHYSNVFWICFFSHVTLFCLRNVGSLFVCSLFLFHLKVCLRASFFPLFLGYKSLFFQFMNIFLIHLYLPVRAFTWVLVFVTCKGLKKLKEKWKSYIWVWWMFVV